MKVLVLVALLFAVADASPVYTKTVGDIWSDCSKSTDPVKIGKVNISPDPPKKDESITVDGTFTSSINVTGGKIEAKLKWGFVTVLHQTLEICDVSKEAGLPCPITAGEHEIKLTESLPSATPSGHYTGNIEVTDDKGQELACINLDFHL